MSETGNILAICSYLYAKTVPCFESIFRHTEREDYEVAGGLDRAHLAELKPEKGVLGGDKNRSHHPQL